MSINTMNRMTKKAFTLVELLVVMAVIGVLATLSLFGLKGARESARDAVRKSNLETIASGLELYKADCKVYPIGAGDFYSLFGSSFTDNDGGASSCGSGSNIYIQEVPKDSINGRNYYYVSSGVTYTLCTGLESDNTLDSICSSAGANCGSSVVCSYHVVNP